MPAYLFFGMLPGSAVGAFFAFCDRVLYPSYIKAPALFRITALTDQILAGTLMWVFGVFVCLLPAVAITLSILSPRTGHLGIPLPDPREVRAQEIVRARAFSQL